MTILKHDFEKNWKNIDNAAFYNTIPLNLLPDFAAKGGLDTCCDLDLIRPNIDKACSILEIGSGYGRVLNGLITKGYARKLVAIERSPQFYEILQTQFSNNAEIINADIQSYEIKNKFDLILWLWSGICDFTKDEQLPILWKLLQNLNIEGILVFDTMPPSIHPINATNSIEQYAIIPGGNNNYLRVYTPSSEEIDVYAKELNMYVKHLPYTTTTGRKRLLHFLTFCKNKI